MLINSNNQTQKEKKKKQVFFRVVDCLEIIPLFLVQIFVVGSFYFWLLGGSLHSTVFVASSVFLFNHPYWYFSVHNQISIPNNCLTLLVKVLFIEFFVPKYRRECTKLGYQCLGAFGTQIILKL